MVAQIPPRAGAIEQQAHPVQTLERVLVGRQVVALVNDGPVPDQAVGFEGGSDAFNGAGIVSGNVQVVEAQVPGVTGGTGVQIAGGGGEQGSEV